MPQYPSVIELSALDGLNGFRLDGEAGGDYSGIAVASAGDVNGDGFSDIIIGANHEDTNGADSGASYVVFGKASSFGASFALSALDGTNGFKIRGVAEADYSGRAVSSAGDVNGDGFDDIIVGAWLADPNSGGSGAAYVVFGKASGFAAGFELSGLDGTNGFRIDGEGVNQNAGWSVSSAGDRNNDGFDDLAVGAVGVDTNGDNNGAGYVIYGKATGFDANFQLSGLTGANGFQVNGEAGGDFAGRSIASAGDVNNDGFGDLIIGADFSDAGGNISGAAYVVFGKTADVFANVPLALLDGGDGFEIRGEESEFLTGTSVGSAGDINGDGFDDIVVGSIYADPNGYNSGAAHVVFGKASGFAAVVQLSALTGADGFQISGEAAYDLAGRSVASAGDVNGDGFDDVIVGAYRSDANGGDSGASYVVFGKASGFGAEFQLSALDGTNGFRIDGAAANDRSGLSAASAGDLNGDGLDDIVIGAYQADANGSDSGASYVVYGRKPDASVARTGTGASQSLVGGDFGDTLSGLGGDDALWGHGSADTLDGGTGADAMRGGAGNDTYIVDNAGDSAIEVSGAAAGYDSVRTTLALYTLSDNVERLYNDAATAITAIGNALANIVYGNNGDDKFRDYAGGADRFAGGNGQDSMYFTGTAAAVLNFATGVHGGSAAGDAYSSIENFFGSNSDGDMMTAGAGRSIFNGQGGNDTLNGGANIDRLYGGAGMDTLSGGGGGDALYGGADNDMLAGGGARDYFIYSETAASGGWGADTIADFQDGVDVLKFANSVADAFSDFIVTGNGTANVLLKLTAAPANTIAIQGASAITLSAADFQFF